MNLTRKSPPVRTAGGKTCRQNINPDYNNSRIGFNENRPPCNIEAETTLIENLIYRPAKTAMAKSIVSPADFYSMTRSKVYERILEFHESKRVWNWTTLRDSFQADQNFLKYEDFFDDLIPFTSEVVKHNARLVKDCSNERRLIAATYEANISLFNGEGLEPVRAILERVLAEVACVPTR